jgi:hypothetical protein
MTNRYSVQIYPLVAIRVGLPWAPCDSTDNQHDTCLWT